MTTADHGAASVMQDDGFTAEERSQFAEMEQSTPPQRENAPEPAPQVAPVEEQQPLDDDDDLVEAGDQQPQDGQAKQPPRRVNYGKFQRMEERAKKAETELGQVREMFSRTDERLKLLNEALTSGQQRQEEKNEEKDPEPDPEQDIFGWVQWSRRKTQRLEQMISDQRQTVSARDEERVLADSYLEDARAFSAKEQNFAPAYQFLMANRTYELAEYYFGKDLTEDGVGLTPQEAQRIKTEIAAEERELVAAAMKNGQSPAQRIFKLAKARGFRPESAPQGGTQKPTASAVPQSPSVKDEIAKLQQGTKAATSLSLGGGSPGTSALTPERLANMSQDEFDSLMDSLTPAQQRAAMGG